MKKSSNKKVKILVCLCIIAIIFFIVFLSFRKYYKISDRVDKMKSKSDYPVIGWIRVQGTNIDYPVLYANETGIDIYNINSDYSFAWRNINTDTLNERTIVLGHNIRNVSSKPLKNEEKFNNFENIPSFLYYDFVKENKYIQYTVGKENYLFKIYSVYMTDSNDFNYSEYLEKTNKNNYIKDSKKKSYFDFDVDVNDTDKLISLVTCTRFYGATSTSIVVDGRLVRKDENIKNYSVKENKNYKEIKKIMEGDEENEKA